jgi:hypothetical protein
VRTSIEETGRPNLIGSHKVGDLELGRRGSGPLPEPHTGRELRPLRLISLREACLRRGISVRSYWRDTSQLPLPVKGKGKHLFLEQEVDILIDRLLSDRGA